MNLLWSTSYFDVDILDNPWFNRDVDGYSLCNVPYIAFRENLMDLNTCLKGLGRDTRIKLLKTSNHNPMAREK